MYLCSTQSKWYTFELLFGILLRYHLHAVYLNDETPIEEFSLWHDKIFMLRRGFGFLIVDNLKRTSNGWSYAYHAPWFDDKISSTTGTKFKGYYDL